MAAITAARTPPASSACSPAMVVPPGDATLSFNRAGCSPVSSTCLAAPSTVCAARVKAVSRGSPTLTPPSAKASMIWNTYAGPLPLRPVTASINRSSTTTTVPTASNSRMARARSSTDTAHEAGRVGHHPHQLARATQAGGDPRQGNPRRNGHDEGPFRQPVLETVEHRIHRLGLDRQDDHVRPGGRRCVVVAGPDPIALAQGGKPVRGHVRDPEPCRRRHPVRQETGQQGLTHVPAANDRDLDHAPPARASTRQGAARTAPSRCAPAWRLPPPPLRSLPTCPWTVPAS